MVDSLFKIFDDKTAKPMNLSEKKIFATILFSIFITILGVGLVVPLLPVYAHELGASGFMISMIFGALSITRTIFLPYFGKLSDVKGRKPFIVAGLFSYSLVGFAFMISANVNSLIFIRCLQGVAAAMIMPISQAYVADLTPEGREGRIMSIYNMALLGSLSLGPIFGGVINEHFGLEITFACMGILALLAFVMGICFLPPTRSEKKQAHSGKSTRWVVLMKDGVISGTFLMRFSYLFCIGIIWCFLPVYVDIQFHLSSTAIGILVSMGVLLSGIIQYPMGYIADKTDKVRMIGWGALLIFISMFLFIFAKGFWDLFFINILFGIGGGILNPPLMAISVIKGNSIKEMGSVMSLLTMAQSMGMLLGPFCAGLIMDLFRVKHAFLFGAMVMAICGCLFVFLTYGSEIKAVVRNQGL